MEPERGPLKTTIVFARPYYSSMLVWHEASSEWDRSLKTAILYTHAGYRDRVLAFSKSGLLQLALWVVVGGDRSST